MENLFILPGLVRRERGKKNKHITEISLDHWAAAKFSFVPVECLGFMDGGLKGKQVDTFLSQEWTFAHIFIDKLGFQNIQKTWRNEANLYVLQLAYYLLF